MDTAKNTITIDAHDNPDLKELVGSWKVGEKGCLKVEYQVNDVVNNGDFATLSIESVQPEGYENPDAKEGEDENEITPKADSPVMIALGGSIGKEAE